MDEGTRSTLQLGGGAAALADTLASLVPGGPAEKPAPVPAGAERFAPGALIGEGGMGRVVEADDRQFGRRVVLKELHGDGASAESTRRFAVEALVTGNLEHPGIPAVYERGVRALLYHVLSGHAPYRGQTSMAALAAALEGTCEPIDRAAPHAPPSLRASVTRAMSRDPRDRPRNATEVVELLGAFMTNAMQQRPPSLAIRVGVALVSVAVLAMAFLGTAMTVRIMPSLHEQGIGAVALPYLTLVTAALAIIEKESA